MPDDSKLVLGPAKVYISTTVADSLPADSVAKGGSWGGSWVDLGYTNGDVSMTYEEERTHATPAQTTMKVRTWVTSQNVSISATLEEATLANLKYVLGHGTLATSGSTEVFDVGDNPTVTEYSLGLEGQSPNADSAFRRVQVYRVVGEPNVEYAFSRENQSFFQLNMTALLHDAGAAGANVARWRDYID